MRKTEFLAVGEGWRYSDTLEAYMKKKENVFYLWIPKRGGLNFCIRGPGPPRIESDLILLQASWCWSACLAISRRLRRAENPASVRCLGRSFLFCMWMRDTLTRVCSVLPFKLASLRCESLPLVKTRPALLRARLALSFSLACLCNGSLS